jgi:Ni/Fe-hydrogenase subunit HybB-like protein
MSMDPHWYSTLFGAYSFVKAFYIGLGAIIVTAAYLHLNPNNQWQIESKQFHDIGKLFFAFCLVWADFFYCQLVVIWYGNISEETAYVIQRTMLSPWRPLAWIVFVLCFIAPFLILLKRNVKMQPRFMMVLCSLVIFGIWLEHLLLLGPALNHHAKTIPMGMSEILITLGFLGLMVFAVSSYLKVFPEIEASGKRREA